MKNRATLVLMEQLIMILVFALAGVLCLRAFLWGRTVSQDTAQRDMALLRAQNAAQIVKAGQGDFEQAVRQHGGSCADGVWTVEYDAEGANAQQLEVRVLQDLPERLGGACVQVSDRAGQTLAELELRWQEVEAHG